jgi:hypothetical protein
MRRERKKTRALLPSDDAAIRAIAQQMPGFTVPSAYVIWMLAMTQRNFCRVVSDGNHAVLGYCLALACACREEGFLWQIGVNGGGLKTKIAVLQSLIQDCIEQGRKAGIRRVFFTAQPGRVSYLNRCLRQSGCGEACEVDGRRDPLLQLPTTDEKLYVTILSDAGSPSGEDAAPAPGPAPARA